MHLLRQILDRATGVIVTFYGALAETARDCEANGWLAYVGDEPRNGARRYRLTDFGRAALEAGATP